MKIDLHLHSIHSADGQIEPVELIDLAYKSGLSAISIADHDTTEAYHHIPDDPQIEVINGVELTTTHLRGITVHMLGYFMNPFHPKLLDVIEKLKEARRKQAIGRAMKLRQLGFEFSDRDVEKYAEGKTPVGPIFAMAILNNTANDNDERLLPYRKGGARSRAPYYYFDKDFLQEGKLAYYPVERISTIDAIKLITEIGGVPVLGHPGEKYNSDDPNDDIKAMADAGLGGIEVFSSYHTGEQTIGFLKLARRYNLVATAGSDFHGPKVKPHIVLGDISSDYGIIKKLRARIFI
ncbi:MAG: PHP domain-containing protein [bacterium]